MEFEVPLIRQKKFMWCWAACIEMVLKYNGIGDISQEIIAEKYKELRNLQSDGNVLLVSNANSLLENIDKFNQFEKEIFFIKGMQLVDRLIEQISGKENLNTLIDKFEINSVLQALDNKNPVLAIIKTGGTSPHMIVVTGYEKIDGKIKLIINNPGLGIENSLTNWQAKKMTIEMKENGDFANNYSIHKYLIIHQISQRSTR